MFSLKLKSNLAGSYTSADRIQYENGALVAINNDGSRRYYPLDQIEAVHGPLGEVPEKQQSCWWRYKSDTKWRPGKLHGWSVNSEQRDTVVVQFPVAIVQDDGTVRAVPIDCLSLGEKPPELAWTTCLGAKVTHTLIRARS